MLLITRVSSVLESQPCREDHRPDNSQDRCQDRLWRPRPQEPQDSQLQPRPLTQEEAKLMLRDREDRRLGIAFRDVKPSRHQRSQLQLLSRPRRPATRSSRASMISISMPLLLTTPPHQPDSSFLTSSHPSSKDLLTQAEFLTRLDFSIHSHRRSLDADQETEESSDATGQPI